MSKERLNKVIEAGFIPGIYNYCDRWCEKCSQQLHCMSYVMGKRIEEKGSFHFSKGAMQGEENLWGRLKEVFESTYEVLHELAQEQGIEVEDIYEAEDIDKEFWGGNFESHLKDEKKDALVENNDIIRVAMIYERVADKYLEEVYSLLEKEEKNNDKVDDAVDTVNWYLDLIQAKMRRALYSFSYQKEIDEIDECNGSAKVALISVDCSLEGWSVLSAHYPGLEKEIGHIRIILTQLKADIEKQFPDARQFLRPGFERPVKTYKD